MNGDVGAIETALRPVLGLDCELVEVVWLSLRVTGSATLCAALIGLPLGGAIAVWRFPGRPAVVAGLNTLMGLPPVAVGLLLYLLLSRAGPLGPLGLLFTPGAMILAQTLLITPIIGALAQQTVADLADEYGELLDSLDVGRTRAVGTLLWEGRYSLLTTVLAGFGRAIGEVGAVLVVGGNIAHVTRVMTTTIALETSKGNLPLALGLGCILVALAFLVNALVMTAQLAARRVAG